MKTKANGCSVLGFRLAPAAFCGLCAMISAASGATFNIKDGATDWTVKESYEEGAVPGADDIVVVPAGATVTVADDASFEKVRVLERIIPSDGDSTIIFNVAEGAVRTNGAAIRGTSGTDGVIVKKGGGELAFTSVERLLSSQSCNDYRVSLITVEEGVLRMPSSAPNREYQYGTIAVSNKATFVLPTKGTGGGSSFFAQCLELCGEGEITCPSASQLRVNGGGEQEFRGAFTGSARSFSAARLMLTGTNSTTTSSTSAYGGPNSPSSATGVTGLKKFGMTGEPSSIGAAGYFTADYKGGGFLYLGDGETTDKEFWINRGQVTGGMTFLDAGAKGGVKFRGTWGQQNSGHTRLESIYLYGSNTAPCTIAAPIGNWSKGTTNLAFHLVKRGSGVWRMSDGVDQTFAGAITVEEGTFQVDSIEDRRYVSAVGTSERLYQPGYAAYRDDLAVDYAFALGATNSSGEAVSEGTFEYTGTNGVAVWSRPLALKGHGRIRNDTAMPFRFRGVSAIGAGERILTLDGEGVNQNEIADITDGEGVVSVVKEGDGKWTISGTNTFSGDLDVRGGTLVVRNVTATNYTWFIWTVKESCVSALKGSYNAFKIPEFGMFDADGNQVAKGLAFSSNYVGLAAGQMALANRNCYNHQNNSTPARLFDGRIVDDGGWEVACYRNGAWYSLVASKPNNWVPIMFRLKEGAGIVSSYDIAITHGAATADGGVSPRTFTLQGSVDGLHWDMLDDVSDALAGDDPSKNGGMVVPADQGKWCWYWMYAGKKADRGDTQVHAGKPLSGTTDVAYPMLTGVRSVSVSGGATLAVEGDPVEIRSLTVDCRKTGGCISNFTFAAAGTLTVVNADPRENLKLPIDLTHAGNVDELEKWTLSASNLPAGVRIKVKGSEVHLHHVGLVLSIR